jgi:hypothetical protein
MQLHNSVTVPNNNLALRAAHIFTPPPNKHYLQLTQSLSPITLTGEKEGNRAQDTATSCPCPAPSCPASPWRSRRNGCASAVAGSACPRACCPHSRPSRRARCAVGLCRVKSVQCKLVQCKTGQKERKSTRRPSK